MAVLAAGGTGSGFAQSDYAAKGLPLRAFRLFPTMQIGAAWDDNIFRTSSHRQASSLFNFAPAIVLQSQWSVHMLELNAGLNSVKYGSASSEDRTDWNVGGKGRLDIVRTADIAAGASYVSAHELRASPNQPGSAAAPTPYSQWHLDSTIGAQPTRVGVSAGVIYDSLSYERTRLRDGGTLDNADREQDTYQLWGKVGYEFSPGYAAFLRSSYTETAYRRTTDRTGLDRNTDGYAINGGLAMLVTDLIEGQFFVGYFQQNYIAPLPDVAGVNFGAGIRWTPTSRLVAQFNAARTLVPTVIANASTEDDRHVDGGLQYAFSRDIAGEVVLGYTDAVFTGTPRSDKITDASFNLRYFLSRYVNVNARYSLSRRDSSLPGQDYRDGIIMIAVNLQS